MYNFYQPEISDFEWIKEKLAQAVPVTCDYSASHIIAWSKYYKTQIADIEGCLVDKEKDKSVFGFPKGKYCISALKAINNLFDTPTFCGLTNDEKIILENTFPNEYKFQADRDTFDYIYKVSDLAALSGKKYHSKRNHISYFKKNFNWTYEEINEDNISDCIALNQEWYLKNTDKNPEDIEIEKNLLKFSFDNYKYLGFLGGLLRVDGKAIAYTFGEKLNDTMFDTHFEKARSDIRGAYPMINMLFAENTISDFEYVNREDDTGDPGLRKAKLSYNPTLILEKYTAVKL